MPQYCSRTPRAQRLEYAGAIYHVINRGNQRQDTFGDRRDRGVASARLREGDGPAGLALGREK
jgi:hypothetical protein